MRQTKDQKFENNYDHNLVTMKKAEKLIANKSKDQQHEKEKK